MPPQRRTSQGTTSPLPRILADFASSPCTSLGFRRFAAPPRDYEPQRNPRSHPAMRPHLLGSRGGFRRSGGYHLFAPRPAHPEVGVLVHQGGSVEMMIDALRIRAATAADAPAIANIVDQ